MAALAAFWSAWTGRLARIPAPTGPQAQALEPDWSLMAAALTV